MDPNQDELHTGDIKQGYPSQLSNTVDTSKLQEQTFDQYTRLTKSQFNDLSSNQYQIPYEESLNAVKIDVIEPVHKGSGIQKYTTYFIRIKDNNGQREIYRRYSEFDTVRNVLLQRWPGVFIPAIPSKQVLNKNDTQVTQNRIRFLNDFLKKIAEIDYLYTSPEFQTFLNPSEIDVVKSLQGFKKQTYAEILAKYQQCFQQYNDAKDVYESQKISTEFQTFIKDNKTRMLEFRKQARTLAESRQRYDQKLASVFEKILPQYETNSLHEFANGDESKMIFKRISEIEELSTANIKNATSKNVYWLIYDVIKFQEREMEAILEALKGLAGITNRKEDAIHDIKNNNQQIEALAQGKTTIRSLLTKGTNEEIQTKLAAENQQLQKRKQTLQEIQNILTEYLAKTVLHNFKITRQRFFGKAIKQVFSYQMHYTKFMVDYYDSLKQISEKFITKN